MKPIDVYSTNRTAATCRGCGRPIIWATVAASGRLMPFDTVHVIGTKESPHGTVHTVDLDLNHWGTCPAAGRFRKGRTHA